MSYLISPEQQRALRASGTGTPYLSIYEPVKLLSCQINGNPARGQRSIVYNNGTGTGFTEIQPHYTVMIGTAPGLSDVGLVRLRAITGNQSSGTMALAENNIIWEDNLHLTVLRVVDLWPVFPRFTTDGTFYKDWDVLYADQNRYPPPICVAGPPQIQWLNGNRATFPVDLSRSYAIAPAATVGGGVAGFSGQVWPRATSAITLDPFTGIGAITVTAPGAYYAKFTATDSNGKTQDRYVVLFAHNDDYRPLAIAVKGRVTSRWSSPGWNTSITTYDDIRPRPGTLAVIWYQAAEYTARRDGANLIAVGYVRTSKVDRNEVTGAISTTVQISSIINLMGRHRALNISLNGTANPARWYHYRNELTAGRAVHHLYAWHSTLLYMTDVFNLTQDGRWAQNIDFEESNLYDQANSVMWQHGILARFATNLVGQLFMEKEIQYLPDASRDAVDVLLAIEPDDRAGQITYTRNEEQRMGIVHVSGFSWDGTKPTPLISVAPGKSPEWLGTGIDSYERQILTNQELTNDLSGRILGAANNVYPDINLSLVGAYQGVLDIVPQYWLHLPDAGNDWTDTTRFVCREITVAFDSDKGAITTTVSLEMEAEADPGVPGDYPGPENVTDRPDWVTFPKLEGGCENQEYMGALVLFGSAYWRSFSTDWESIDGGIYGIDSHGCIFEPWQADQDTADQRNLVLLRIANNELYVTWDRGVSWSQIFPYELPVPNPFVDFPAPETTDLELVQVVSDLYSTAIYVLVRWTNAYGEYRSSIVGAIDWGWAYKTTFRGAGLRIALDQGNGKLLWVTYYDEVGQQLALAKYEIGETGNFSAEEVFPLGAASLSQLVDRSRFATPVTPEGFYGFCAILGTMEQPQGLGADLVQVIETTNAGKSWTLLQEGWTDELRAGIYLKEPREVGTALFSFGDADNDGAILSELMRYKTRNAGQILLSTDYGANYTADTPASVANPWNDATPPALDDIMMICCDNSPVGSPYILGSWVSSNGLQRGGVWYKDGSGWKFLDIGERSYTELKPIWLTVNSGYLLVSYWADNELYIRAYSLSTLNSPQIFSFGACSLSQLDNKTYYLFPATVDDSPGLWYAAGRMATIPGLTSNLTHVAVWNGTNWSVVESSWGESYCAALVVGPDTGGGQREMFAVRHPKETA